ncbi:MAG: lipase [Nocardioides sp.]|nr:lipase [Nocardioides sp.]
MLAKPARALVLGALAGPVLVIVPAPAQLASQGAAAQVEQPGTVLRVDALRRDLWLPNTSKAAKLTYSTTDTFGDPAPSSGAVFFPRGKAPHDGWPVISWAHGTSGLADTCAPSGMGPALPERDRPYLAGFLRAGYAVVASDYAGLGTRGLHAYLDGRATAHNVVDMVKAARNYSHRLPARLHLAEKWVAVGQSQRGGASIYTARYATRFGGASLDYRGAVGTGTPAYIEDYLNIGGPASPPVSLPPGLTAYVAYIFASLRYAHPELGIDDILTDTGRKYLAMAERLCVFEFEDRLDGVVLGDFFTRPVVTLPNFRETVRHYMGMPEGGFDKPFFMGHGALDTDVPYAMTARYAAVLEASDEPVTFKTYPSDHSGTLIMSQADTLPFIAARFRN